MTNGRPKRQRRCSKKHALSLAEGFVQCCAEPVEGKATALLTHGAYSQYVSTSGAKRQVCEPEGQENGRPAYAKPLSAFVAHFGEVGSAGMELLACQP